MAKHSRKKDNHGRGRKASIIAPAPEAPIPEETQPAWPRPAPDPLSTADAGSRYSLHQRTVPIILEDGSEAGLPTKVQNTLDTTGAPEIAPSFVARLDARTVRPLFAQYLRLYHMDEHRLRVFLPLCPAEALALLERRDSELAFIVGQTEPVGHLTLQEMGEKFLPPVPDATIFDRQRKAIKMLATWMAGTSYLPNVKRFRPDVDKVAYNPDAGVVCNV